MLYFENDYSAGAHPEILRRLVETNDEPLSGYGTDLYSARAKEKIRRAVGIPDAGIVFLAGGTQTNAVVISSMLRDCEGVVSASSGHVASHEAGAIEYSGHKVIELPQKDGKLEPSALEAYLSRFFADANRDHMVFPGMVYLSYPTEFGTIYSKKELEEIRTVCSRFGIPVYIDGARLGYGLVCKSADVTLPEIARLCDVFTIGGTKVGALCGEAVVFTKNNMPEHFITSVKKRGALLAKGRLLGVQFDALFTDDLYFRISRRVIGQAEKLKELLAGHGMEFYVESPTNQQFVVLDDRQIEKLKPHVRFAYWERICDGRTAVRFAVSFSTGDEDLTKLSRILDELQKTDAASRRIAGAPASEREKR